MKTNLSISRNPCRRPLGGSTVEYLMILGLVVIPIALLMPLLVGMIVNYTHRVGWVIRLPFG